MLEVKQGAKGGNKGVVASGKVEGPVTTPTLGVRRYHRQDRPLSEQELRASGIPAPARVLLFFRSPDADKPGLHPENKVPVHGGDPIDLAVSRQGRVSQFGWLLGRRLENGGRSVGGEKVDSISESNRGRPAGSRKSKGPVVGSGIQVIAESNARAVHEVDFVAVNEGRTKAGGGFFGNPGDLVFVQLAGSVQWYGSAFAFL